MRISIADGITIQEAGGVLRSCFQKAGSPPDAKQCREGTAEVSGGGFQHRKAVFDDPMTCGA
jgi:hypothetical protein